MLLYFMLISIIPGVVLQLSSVRMPGWIMHTMLDDDAQQFVAAMVLTTVLCFGNAICNAVNFAFVGWVQMTWRTALSGKLHEWYFTQVSTELLKILVHVCVCMCACMYVLHELMSICGVQCTYYKVCAADTRVDNPDQRVQQDAKQVPNAS